MSRKPVPRSASKKATAPTTQLQTMTDNVFKFDYGKWFMGKDKFSDVLIPSLAEFAASVCFVFIACGAAMTTTTFGEFPGAIDLQISLVFGFTITALAFTIGHISGGHINFAVTFAFIVSKRISPMRGLGYFIAQLSGGVLGAACLKAIMPLKWQSATCFAANAVNPAISLNQAFFMEFFLTFFLLFVVSAATDSTKNEAQGILTPLAIGLCIYCCHIVGIPFTGTSINPTRTFASAVASSNVPGCEKVWDNMALFWFAPILGGIVATFVYQFAFATYWGESLVDIYRDRTISEDENVEESKPVGAALTAEDVYHNSTAVDPSAVDSFDPRFDAYPAEKIQAHTF